MKVKQSPHKRLKTQNFLTREGKGEKDLEKEKIFFVEEKKKTEK